MYKSELITLIRNNGGKAYNKFSRDELMKIAQDMNLTIDDDRQGTRRILTRITNTETGEVSEFKSMNKAAKSLGIGLSSFMYRYISRPNYRGNKDIQNIYKVETFE